MTKQEKKNDRTAWTVSIVIHALLLIAFIFMVAWREPNPPLPEIGIEVNFGTDNVGSGDVQPTEPANTSESEEESDPAPAEEEVIEDQLVEESTPEEVTPEDVIDPVSQESTVEDTPTETITQDAPSPDVIEEEPKAEETTESEVVKEEPVEQPKVEEKKEEQEPVKTPVLYEKKETNTTDGTGETDTEAQKANQGDNTNEAGDKGQEEGSLDSRTLYGNQGGGGGGPELNISGWIWDEKPDKKDDSSETGIIEFSFTVDEQGEVIGIKVIQSTLSSSVTNFYKRQLQNITFSQTDLSVAPLPQTKGTVKFVIKSK